MANSKRGATVDEGHGFGHSWLSLLTYMQSDSCNMQQKHCDAWKIDIEIIEFHNEEYERQYRYDKYKMVFHKLQSNLIHGQAFLPQSVLLTGKGEVWFK